MALTLICSVSVPLSLHNCVITICLSLKVLSAATTIHPTNCYTTPKCLHWQVNATQQELLWSNSKDFSSLSQRLHRHSGGLANTASNRAPQNNCWLYPKVKHKTKRQDYSIFGFWVSDFCIENFKLLQQRAMGLPKNWIPFFGTFRFYKKKWCDTKHSRKCCVHSSIILYVAFPAKQHLVKEKKKNLQNCTSNDIHFYMLRITR